MKFVEHRGHLVAGHLLQLRHGETEALHLLGVELFQQIGGVLFAQAHEQNGGALRPIELFGL